MRKAKFFGMSISLWLLLFTNACVSASTFDGDRAPMARWPAQAQSSAVRLVPQEIFGNEVLDLLSRRSQDGITILQFNFFTDNREESYPKKIAERLLDIRRQYPKAEIIVALESKKDADSPDGKGAAQRNAKTKDLLGRAGIDVRDVHGQSRELQDPQGQADGVSHTKLVMAGDEIIAGSSNLTKQSTDIGANNEMNIAIRSQKIASAVRAYVAKIIANPGQMVDQEIEDGSVRLLTDRLHFAELIAQIRRAQKGDQLGLSMYQFLYRNENDQQARQVFEQLLAAHGRGVQLEIFLNRAEDLSIQNTAANLQVAERLLQAGVSKVYFDPEAKISHSKFLYRISATEKVAMISSVNIYRGDFNDNHQLTWVVKDAVLTEQLAGYFKQQIANDGVLVSRIPKDPRSGQRYKVISNNPEKTIWNKPEVAPRMLRFWRGFRQDDISRNEFEANVNTRLIPETIAVGGGRGLNAYLPSFFVEGKPDFLPDEIAIVDYADEEKYNAIRTTERGRKYGPLHFEQGLFAQQNRKGLSSGSLVATTYTGVVEVRPEGRAYILGDPHFDWQEGIVIRRTILPLQNLAVPDAQYYLTGLQNQLAHFGINAAVAVIDPRYIIIMFNSPDARAAELLDSALAPLEKARFKKFEHTIFESQKHGATHLAPGSGINVKFDFALKPRPEIMTTVLQELRNSPAMGGVRCEKLFQ